VPAMRQRRRRAFDRGTGGDGQDSAGRVPAGIPGATAVRVRFTATIDELSSGATIVWTSGATIVWTSGATIVWTSGATIVWTSGAGNVGISDATSRSVAGVRVTAELPGGTATGIVAGVGSAAGIHRAAASRSPAVLRGL
jgi:hypothetical protein